MRWLAKGGSLVALASALSGCVTTSEMPLAKNVWQIHAAAGGSLFTGQADKATLKRAAELTIAQGYDHFVIQNPQAQNGSTYVGSTPVVGNTSVSVVGNMAYGTTTYSGGEPIMAPTRDVVVTVVMYHANEPQAAQAVDAAVILKQMNS